MTRVFVIDDHPIVTKGVELVLDGSEGLEFAGGAPTMALARTTLASREVDVILLDARLPDSDVEASVKLLRVVAPTAQVVLFTADPAHPHLRRAHAAGAVLTVAKDTPPAQLRDLIRAVASGNHRPGGLPEAAGGSATATGLLTARQMDVLSRIAVGMTNLEIAGELGIQPTTVKAYWQETMQRLGVRNRAEAIAAAYRRGLL